MLAGSFPRRQLQPQHAFCLQALARYGAADAIDAAEGIPPLVKLLEGGLVSAGALSAVQCLAELVKDSRCGFVTSTSSDNHVRPLELSE